MSVKKEKYSSPKAAKRHESKESVRERTMEYGPKSKKTTKAIAAKKTSKVMKEYKAGTLHSGKGGPVVKSRKQAIAIALSEGRKATSKKVPKGFHRMPNGKIMKGSRHK